MVTPPPLDRPRNCISDLSRKRGGGGGKSTTPKFSKLQKNPTQVSDFGNSRNLLKIQKNQKFLEFPKSKIPTPVSDFWKLEEFAQNPKKPKILEKFQKSKNPNPSFGFLETRGICSKSKKTQNSSSFQNSKNPKTPTPVSDFWKLEEFAQNPKKPKIPRVSKIPKIQKSQPQFRIFGNSRNLLKIQKKPKIPRVSKIPKIQKPQPQFRIFGNSRNLLKIQKNPKFLEFPKSKKTQNPSFQKSETGVGVFGFVEFWKLEEFWVFLDFEQIPRVSKNPKLGLGFLDFWNFGNSRNFGFFWISRLPLEFLKIQTLGWNFWILGILETRGILGFFGF